jgi:hypothetical protein
MAPRSSSVAEAPAVGGRWHCAPAHGCPNGARTARQTGSTDGVAPSGRSGAPTEESSEETALFSVMELGLRSRTESYLLNERL